ncbi:7TM GPCR protein [Aphelenchoides avenae]|nr:7TM GPCR protein [Aphelenchus avenae]
MFSAYNIRKSLRCPVSAHSKLSERQKSLHRQLDYALALQAVNPLVLMVIPEMGTIVAVLGLATQLKPVVLVTTTVVSLIPILNPLSTILFVKCYRQAVEDLFSAEFLFRFKVFATDSMLGNHQSSADVSLGPTSSLS